MRDHVQRAEVLRYPILRDQPGSRGLPERRQRMAEIAHFGLELQRPVPNSEHFEPPVDVAAAIAARCLMKLAHRKKNFSSRLMKLFGNLAAGCAAPHNQDRARWQLPWIAIVARVNLKYVDGQ